MRLRVVTDTALLLLVAATAPTLRTHLPVGADPAAASRGAGPAEALWIVAVWMAVLTIMGAYSLRRAETTTEQQRILLSATVVALGMCGTALYLFDSDLTRSVLVVAFSVGYGALAASRLVVGEVVVTMRRRGRGLHRAVLLGSPHLVREAVNAFSRAPRLGYHFVGTVGAVKGDAGLLVLGEENRLRDVCVENDVDTVVLAGHGDGPDDLRSVSWALQGTGIEVLMLPNLIDVASPRVRLVADAGIARVHLAEPQFQRAARLAKRTLDLVGVTVLLVLSVPLMAFATWSILRDGGRPVFFRQTRVGRGGETFECLKFRTMTTDAQAQEASLRSGHEGVCWKLRADPRVTRSGRWLRTWSVDELPQMLNVLRGEMSLVGPRPQQPHEVETYSPAQARRLLVRPGMTGLWQVSGRSDLTADEAVRLDLYYVENWSLTIDIVILVRTVRAVLSRAGAY